VKVLLLAAGYATRLRPLTETVAKPLLPVGGRPMADWILDRVVDSREVDAVHVVTNSVYAPAFERWAQDKDVVVHDDGTSSNDDRLGALGDVRFALRDGRLAGDDLLVIAADNLFEFPLSRYIDFWRSKGHGSALAVYQLADPSLAPLYGVVELDENDRIVGMEEKPEHPKSDVVATAMYLFSHAHVTLLERYLDEGNAPDPPGRYVSWLCEREPVYGFRFSEQWLDIGDPQQLLEADNRYREAAGLPVREAYSLTG
jgi:glucose-1-phosphate thymidylyltransferase